MKILITSGGTIVPIDKVRRISNMSHGTFGSKLATEFLSYGHDVMFFHAAGSKTPMTRTVDLINYSNEEIADWITSMGSLREFYRSATFSTFEEYASGIEKCISEFQPDIILLAAAVSDYGVDNYVDGKIRSKDSMSIHLKPLPKIISKIKQLSPKSKLVGFKLLVNSTESELLDAARKSVVDNGCDMVIANDLRDIRNSNHTVHLVFPNGGVTKYETGENGKDYITRKVVSDILTQL